MCKYLGLYFDDQLTWRFHIDYVYNRLLQLIGIFYKLRSKLQYVWLRNIYYAFVHPYLMYGIEIYANTYVTYLDKLVKINNKLLRILQNQPLADLLKRKIPIIVNYSIAELTRLNSSGETSII